MAEAAPAWLAPLIEPEWAKRYGRRVEIGKLPGGKAAVITRAEEFGQDGQKVLTAAWATWAPPHLRRLPQVEILRQGPPLLPGGSSPKVVPRMPPKPDRPFHSRAPGAGRRAPGSGRRAPGAGLRVPGSGCRFTRLARQRRPLAPTLRTM
ncbi:hypothetical protein [Streptomyces sp. KR55]|uniref:hypothetical protein n=1 Tax=Streptomyces sp. KR55 TaxID=3457425 RepID=UPI003FD4879F